jgi:cation diffusion facilitator family transporter
MSDDGHAHPEDGHAADEHVHKGDEDGPHHRGPLARAWAGLRHTVTPHSHDHAESIDTAMVTSAEGIRVTKVSLVVLGVTAVAQMIVFAFSGSIALLADTIHNISDAFTSVPLWIAFALRARPPSRRYTYGLGRLEDLAGIIIVLFIAASAALAGWESVRALGNPREYDNVGIVALAGIIGFIGNEAVAIYRTRVGRRIGSAALIADGQHARTDGITSLGVLVSAIGVWLGFPQADALVGLAITAAILVILIASAKDVLRRLLDAVDPDLVDSTEATLAAVEGIEAVDAVRMRWVGHRLLAEADVAVSPELDVGSAHLIAERARHELLHAVKGLDDITIHISPTVAPGEPDHHDLTAHHRP